MSTWRLALYFAAYALGSIVLIAPAALLSIAWWIGQGVAALGRGVVWLVDWLTAERRWIDWLFAQADRLQAWYDAKRALHDAPKSPPDVEKTS